MLYEHLLRPLLFSLDPERAHRLAVRGLAALEQVPGGLSLVRSFSLPPDPSLAVEAFGLSFPNPVGLAAGFDKNGHAVRALAALGFGSIEVGGVTAEPLAGNDRPRIARYPADDAIVNWMGLPNDGAEAVARRLERLRAGTPLPGNAVVGLNVAGESVEEYLRVLRRCAPLVDYVTLNVSCPNVPAGRQLSDPAQIRSLLAAVAADPDLARRPTLLKISPDLEDEDVDRLVDLSLEGGAAGIVATNTSAGLARRLGPRGGLSGAPLRDRSSEVVRRIRGRAGSRLTIVAVGGVFTAADAWEKIVAGATLVQLYTGFVYRGPPIIGEIRRGLAQRRRDGGYQRLEDAVGSGAAGAALTGARG